MALSGIHHITAVTGDADGNISFYTKNMGMRMVKLTVNFDQPSSYHLYFGDRTGTPGSVLTFFHWPQMRSGRRGTGLSRGTPRPRRSGSPGSQDSLRLRPA